MALGIDADDAGAGARQHRFGEAAAAVDQVARADDVVALRAQFLRHLVEGLAELGEVALRAPRRHLHIEVAGRDDLSGADQAANGRDEVVGEIESDPDRRQQHDQRDHRVHQAKGDLHADAARFKIGILRDALARRVQLREHARVEQARNVEVGVGIAAQLDDGRDIVGIEKHRDLRLGIVDRGKDVGRRLAEDVADLRIRPAR